ncbi:MAG: ABC transporter ATP-binding protein [Hyphomicrobiaceae bacterium]|nr:ABC transporter ATP-binding protein [Hyphomicrobiaceae bacterium]
MRLEAQGITVALGRRRVLEGASLAAAPGEMIAVVGPNGAGKSTLLRSMAGLLKPLAGSVALGGRRLADWERGALARAIAYLPQARAVHWPLSVECVVALGRLPHGAGPGSLKEADSAAVDAALTAMDLMQFRQRLATELSGGELARVLVARALAQEAQVLLADEPTAGLDPAHQLALFDRLRRIAAEGRSMVVALHDLSLAARFCNRIVLLKDGRSVADGPPEAVLSSDWLAAVYGIEARLVRIDGLPLVVTASELPSSVSRRSRTAGGAI